MFVETFTYRSSPFDNSAAEKEIRMGITYVVLTAGLSNSENIFLLKNQSSRTSGMRFHLLPIGFPTQCSWGEELVKKTGSFIRT